MHYGTVHGIARSLRDRVRPGYACDAQEENVDSGSPIHRRCTCDRMIGAADHAGTTNATYDF